MKVATLQETITVTSQAPLVNTTSSQVSGNIDRRQMAELPLQGRNWQELSLMVKGRDRQQHHQHARRVATVSSS